MKFTIMSNYKLDRIKEYLSLFNDDCIVMADVEFTYEKFVEAIKIHNKFILDIIEEGYEA